MERLAAFTLERPDSLVRAIELLAGTPGARAIAGGTDLVPALRHGFGAPPVLVDLSCVPGLDRLDVNPAGARIGAGVTIASLAADRRVAAALPAVAQAAASIAGPAHRGVATAGGNLCLDTRCVWVNQSAWWCASSGLCLKRGGDTCHVAPQGGRCHAAYSGDLAPALIACDAKVEIAGPAGTRTITLEDLYRDDGRAPLALATGEIVVAIDVPPQPRGARSAYRKARLRRAVDFPLAGVAVRFAGDERRIERVDVALTGTNSRPFRLQGTGAYAGRAVDDALVAEIGKAVARQAGPMRTTVTPAHWRRQAATIHAQRLVRELASMR